MKVRINYVIEVDDQLRRSINEYYGTPGLANRDDIKGWYYLYGASMDDDLAQMADDRSEEE